MKKLTALLLLGLLSARAFADISALVVIEPSNRKDGMMVSRDALETRLSKVLGEPVTVTTTNDMTDAMRSTRSGGYDVFISPPQVAASALAHGYALVGATDSDEQYLLVGRSRASPRSATCAAARSTCRSRTRSTPTSRAACSTPTA